MYNYVVSQMLVLTAWGIYHLIVNTESHEYGYAARYAKQLRIGYAIELAQALSEVL